MTKGIGSASSIAESLSAERLHNMGAQEFTNKINLFEQALMQDLKNEQCQEYINASDGVQKGEANILKKWANKIDEIIGNMTDKLRDGCHDAMWQLRKLHATLMCTIDEKGDDSEDQKVKQDLQQGLDNKNIRYVGHRRSEFTDAKVENAVNNDEADEAEEAEETDSVPYNQKPAQGLKQLSNADLVAESEIIKSDLHLEGDMKRDYDSCFTNVWGKGVKIKEDNYGIIEGNLKKFQEKYKEKLQSKGSSFNKFDNYSKIEKQISYYTELAERAKQENKQQYLDALSNRYKQPSAEQTRAFWKTHKEGLNIQRDFEQNNYERWLDKDS